MSTAVNDYIAVVHEMIAAHHVSAIPGATADLFKARLDALWRKLTPAEQDEAELLQFKALPKQQLVYGVQCEINRAPKKGSP